jgi:hypothetical protein
MGGLGRGRVYEILRELGIFRISNNILSQPLCSKV